MQAHQILKIRNDLNRLFKASAKAWEAGSNSGSSERAKYHYAREINLAEKAEAIIKEHLPGVIVDYPGLYPTFTLTLQGFQEYNVDGLITSYFLLPRNYFENIS